MTDAANANGQGDTCLVIAATGLQPEQVVDLWMALSNQFGEPVSHLIERWAALDFGQGLPALSSSDLATRVDKGRVFGPQAELLFRRVKTGTFTARVVTEDNGVARATREVLGNDVCEDAPFGATAEDRHAYLLGLASGGRMVSERAMGGYDSPLPGVPDGASLKLRWRAYCSEATGELQYSRFMGIENAQGSDDDGE